MKQLNTPQKTADWSAVEITEALHEAGWSINRLAKHHGLSRSTLRFAFHCPAPRCEARIAEALGVMPQQIWPSRYDAEGNSNRPMGRPARKQPAFIPRVIPNLKNNHSTARGGRKVQTRSAA